MPPTARILLVDDHEDTLFALESALAPLGQPLGRATSGDEALKQLLRGNVGVLLLDVHMPGAGGLDVVRWMRRLEQTRHIPVVLLTGFARDHWLGAAAYRLGVADLVTTPVDPWALRTKVRHLHDTHQHRLALEAEVRSLRARLDAAGAPAARPAPPPPHAHVPPARPPGAHTAGLGGDRT
ncbi:two-component system response regulator [Streptomyces albogriseolus]|uniref:response regulator n=1 Tax=Streptomyces albogriseolus TaxID=1887 RepID=UPI003696F3B7